MYENYQMIAEQDVGIWAQQTEIIVVGLGAAGTSAAIEARLTAAKVLVLERASGGGGTTNFAAGHVYAGGGTPVQLAVGEQDSVEDMFNYMMAVTPEPDEAKIRLYCEESVSHFNWLEAQGVPFKRSFYRDKHVVQPTDECLIWSGNEKVWPYSEQATAAARGHKVARTGEEGGALLMEKLIAKASALGVDMTFDAGVKNLVIDKAGHICGVRYQKFKEFYFARASKGVIIAAGGFAMNPEMLAQYCPVLADARVMKQGNPNDDGGGIKLGMAAGGEAIHMAGHLVTSPIYPEAQLLKGILVNAQGQRFVNEDSYHARTTEKMIEQTEGKVYLIVDEQCFGKPEMMGQELIDAWESIDEMERGLGLPAKALQTTMAYYNLHAEQGEDPEFHKYKEWLQPLTHPPYGAFECSLGKAVYVGFTLGGLRTSVDAEVLRPDGSALPGLFAVGACASNIAQDGAGYSSGTCIGESTFFGRRAGVAAARTAA